MLPWADVRSDHNKVRLVAVGMIAAKSRPVLVMGSAEDE